MGPLTQTEFSTIVADVAANTYNVRDASAAGFYAHVEFASRSGKSSIYASLQFDGATGRCTTIQCPTPGATQPLSFAHAVEQKIAERT